MNDPSPPRPRLLTPAALTMIAFLGAGLALWLPKLPWVVGVVFCAFALAAGWTWARRDVEGAGVTPASRTPP